MKPLTVRTLLLLSVFLDVFLIGLVVYDYYKNSGDWMLYVLAIFAIFTLFTGILFATSVSQNRGQTAVKDVVRVTDPAPSTGAFQGTWAIPLAPIHGPVIPTPTLGRISTRAPTKSPESPFKFNGFTLHTRQVELANAGGKRSIYFFSKKKPKSGHPCAKPAGYHVGVNERTGLPFLKRGVGPDGENLTPAQEKTYQAQCGAITADGKQCRNSSRDGSKYCGSHFGYQPSAISQQAVNRKDTNPRVKRAPDTKPTARKSWLNRLRRTAG